MSAPGGNQPNIGIIGAGGLGVALARRLVQLGHGVSIANSRGPDSLTTLAAEIGAMPVSVVEAARDRDIVIVAIPTKAVPELPSGLFSGARSGVVVDTSNYHPTLRDGRIDAIDRGMPESEWVAQHLGHPVIKAFNSIFAESLLEKGTPANTTGRIALSVAGDPAEAREPVLLLIDSLGFEPVEAGGLEDSWRQQTGTPAYCQDLGAASLRRALDEADRGRLAEYRAAEEARIKRATPAQ
jgi:8-hydroxy-5-deazaflavin:NADPH oxidoreductase